jgi:predicted ribosomally synthesized peptide with nif11-like leader
LLFIIFMPGNVLQARQGSSGAVMLFRRGSEAWLVCVRGIIFPSIKNQENLIQMSLENFEQFRQLVLRDKALQQQLRGATERDGLVALAQQLGAERGYSFTSEDVLEALRARQREWIERWMQR